MTLDQRISNHHDSMFQSDNRFLLPSTSSQTTVLSLQVGILGTRSRICGLIQGRAQGLVAFGRLARMPLACTLVIPRRYARPRRQMICAGEAVHIGAYFRKDDLDDFAPDSWNSVQQVQNPVDAAQ